MQESLRIDGRFGIKYHNANGPRRETRAVRETLHVMVGATGFEPATSCSRSRRATGLRYAPPNQPLPKDIVDAPGGTRIPNLLIRSQMLYPIELRARSKRRLHRPVRLVECRHGL